MATPPHALVEITVAPKVERDREKLDAALRNLSAEDPTIEFSFDAESGEFIVGGASEPHIDGRITAIRARAAIGLDIGAPKVAYTSSAAPRRGQAAISARRPDAPATVRAPGPGTPRTRLSSLR
jgi:translation elongation factor EF-G